MTGYYETTPNVTEQSEENRVVNKALTPLPTPHLTGLKLKADISINGLVLNTIDENNVVWVVTEIDGWWNLPESELPDLPRGYADGSYDAVGRFSNRILSLNGSFLPQDPADAPAARDALIQAITLVKTGGWLLVDEGPVRGAYVRLSGSPLITSVNARGRHDFSIGLKAVDPTKYEYIDGNPDGYDYADIASGGSVTVTNGGNIAVPIVLGVTGGLTGVSPASPALIYTGSTPNTNPTIKIIATVTSAETLEIDTYNREVLAVEGTSVLNARSRVSVLVDWIYLEPGTTTVNFVDPSAGTSASCRIYWRSGWIG